MPAYLKIWQAEHGARIRDYFSDSANLSSGVEVLSYFRDFWPFLEQLAPELRHYFQVANRLHPEALAQLPAKYKKYVDELQARLYRYIDSQSVAREEIYAVWAQHLGNGGLERVACQMGEALSGAGKVYSLLDTPEKVEFNASGELIKADIFDPQVHSILKNARRILDLHWKNPGGSYPLANYMLSNYWHKYVPTVHSTVQCDTYYDVIHRTMSASNRTSGIFPAIICVSGDVKEHLEKTYGEMPNAKTLPNPADIKDCQSAPTHKSPFRYALFAGRLNAIRHKGIDLLIQAWKASKLSDDGLKLLLIGAGQLPEQLQEYIATEDMRNSLKVLPFTENIYSYMKGAIFTVAPSRWEGFGCVIVESLACGTPVLASSVGIAADIVRNGRNGLLVNPSDLGELIDGLKRMQEMVPKIRRSACYASVKNFDLEKYGAKLLDTIY